MLFQVMVPVRTGKRLISSRSATIRRERRIREFRISSSSFCVRLLSLGVNAGLRLNKSLFRRTIRIAHQGGTWNMPAERQVQLTQQTESTARISQE